MLRISGRIDFYAIAIHEAIAGCALAFFTNQLFGTPMIAGTAVIDIGARIFDAIRTVGHAGSGQTFVVLTDQAVGASVVAAAAMIYSSRDDFLPIAIGVAIAYFAFSIVADQAVLTAVVAFSAVIQIVKQVMCYAVTQRISQTTAIDALAACTFDAGTTAVLRIVWHAPVLAEFILGQVIFAFACAGNAGAVRTSSAIPPFVCVTVCSIIATIINGICLANLYIILRFDTIVGFTFVDYTFSSGTSHG